MDTLSLDWCSFTAPLGALSDIQYVKDWLSFLLSDDLKMSDRGVLRGYPQGGFFLDGLGRFGYDLDRLEQGFHISLTGGALAFLSVRYPGFDFVNFLREILSIRVPCAVSVNSETGEVSQVEGAKFTRLDFALDDISGQLDLSIISEFVWSRYRDGIPSLTTRYKLPAIEYKSTDGQGYTCYFGSKLSDTRIRIYDKAAEQKIEGHHVRVEFQLRDGKACEISQAVVNSGLSVVSSVLLGYLDFKEVREGFRPQDQKTVSWWSDFLAVTDKIKLKSGGVVRTVEKTIGWLYKQVSPAMSVVSQALGDDVITQLINSGEARLGSSHKDMLSRFFEAGDLVKLALSFGGVEFKQPLLDGRRIFEQKEANRAMFKSLDRQEINIRLAQSSGEYRCYADGQFRILHNVDGFWQLGAV